MGERTETQLARAIEQDAIAALQPQITAITELARAEHAAGQADDIRAKAQKRADEILAAAEAEIDQRNQRWRECYQQARTAGWTPAMLRSAPLSRKVPPGMTRRRTAALRRFEPPASTVRDTAEHEMPPTTTDAGAGPDRFPEAMV